VPTERIGPLAADARAAAALRSVGLSPGRVLLAVRVAALPANIDVASLSTRGVARLPHRAEHVVRLQRALLDQLRDEARRDAAVGVAAIRFEERVLAVEGDNATGIALVELTATGLAVHASLSRTKHAVFTTTVSPAALATLFLAGYITAHVLVDGVTRLRQSGHVRADAAVVTQPYNGEISGQTQMIQAARRAVVAALHAQAQRRGADGALVGPFTTHWSPRHSVVQVTAIADTLVHVSRDAIPKRPQMVTLTCSHD
jgi:uncharacterized protein YbjQ (UPF0145 family)